MNLKKIAFSIIKKDDETITLVSFAWFLFLTAIWGIFSEKNSGIMFFSIVVTALLSPVVLGFLFLKLLEFLNLNIELEEEVKLLKKHGYNNDQIEIIIKNRKDFWILFEELKTKEEKLKTQENDKRIKNLYKLAGVNL